jgi:hypothetical protein
MLPALLACAPATLAPGELDAAAPAVDAPPVAGDAAPAFADEDADWVVDCEGGEDFDTLGDAVEAAADGDKILVNPCEYDETLDFGGKSLWIRSRDGAEDTVIDAPRGAAAVVATSGETAGTILSGFTLTDGGNTYGSAVSIDLSSLRIEDSIIRGNRGWATVYAASGDIELDGVTMEDNVASGGAEVYASKGSAVVTNSDVTCDDSSYGLYFSHGSGAVDWTSIDCEGGYATAWEHAIGRLQRTTHVGSLYSYQEDDHYDDYVDVENVVLMGNIVAEYGSVVLRNSIVEGALSLSLLSADYTVIEGNVFTGERCTIASDVAGLSIRYNTFWDTLSVCQGTDVVGADGNIDEDCDFGDYAGGDYTLSPRSPCEDAGPPEEERNDIDGSRNDIGVYGGIRSIGGGW